MTRLDMLEINNHTARKVMEILIVILISGCLAWWIKNLVKKRAAARLPIIKEIDEAAPAVYKDYQDELWRKPLHGLNDEERIIRRAHEAFNAERKKRNADYQAKKAALIADKKKIARATDFVKTSHLDLALPFIQEETKSWPSWSKMDEGQLEAPVAASDINGSTEGSINSRWVEFRANSGPLYKIGIEEIGIEESRMSADDVYQYGIITLSVDGEEVLSMSVRRNVAKEWEIWNFLSVESLKVGSWIEDFIYLYNVFRSQKEKKSEDRHHDYVRKRAERIDFKDG
jgi:hypothetical protein